MSLCVYLCAVVEGLYTCKVWNFGEQAFFYYVCVVVEGIYTCTAGNFGKQAFLFLFVLLYSVYTHIRLRILARILCVYAFVVAEGI